MNYFNLIIFILSLKKKSEFVKYFNEFSFSIFFHLDFNEISLNFILIRLYL